MEDRYLCKAKRTNNGEWVQGYYVKGLDVFTNCEEIHIIFEPNTMFYSSGETDGWYKVDPSTICQCTGLKDKNGNLIWENDVIKKHFYTDYDACANSEEYVGVVKLIDCAWVVEFFRDERKCIIPIFESMAYSKDVKHFEVIGNVFDNPELLQGN